MVRKYYHLYADGKTVKEISNDEWFKILVKEQGWSNTKLVATVYENEISINKGRNHIFVTKSQLEQILKEEP